METRLYSPTGQPGFRGPELPAGDAFRDLDPFLVTNREDSTRLTVAAGIYPNRSSLNLKALGARRAAHLGLPGCSGSRRWRSAALQPRSGLQTWTGAQDQRPSPVNGEGWVPGLLSPGWSHQRLPPRPSSFGLWRGWPWSPDPARASGSREKGSLPLDPGPYT